jgi:hypothetical protein
MPYTVPLSASSRLTPDVLRPWVRPLWPHWPAFVAPVAMCVCIRALPGIGSGNAREATPLPMAPDTLARRPPPPAPFLPPSSHRTRQLLVANFRAKKAWDGPWGVEISKKMDRPFYLIWLGFPLLLLDHLSRDFYTYWHSTKIPVTDVFGDF